MPPRLNWSRKLRAIGLETLKPPRQRRVIRRAANTTLLPPLKQATPRNSGNLVRTLAIRQTRTRRGTSLRLGYLSTGRFRRGRISGNHAHLVEFGTRERKRRNGHRTGRDICRAPADRKSVV